MGQEEGKIKREKLGNEGCEERYERALANKLMERKQDETDKI